MNESEEQTIETIKKFADEKRKIIQKVNPELDKYVTEKSIDGMFALVQVKEKKIRTDVSARTSDLLKKVFGSQQKK